MSPKLIKKKSSTLNMKVKAKQQAATQIQDQTHDHLNIQNIILLRKKKQSQQGEKKTYNITQFALKIINFASKLNLSVEIEDSLNGLLNEVNHSINMCNKASNYPGLIASLLKLSKYQLQTNFDVRSTTIRQQSLICLRAIQQDGDLSVFKVLYKKGYIRILSQMVSSSGGYGEQCNQSIIKILESINQHFKYVCFGKSYQVFGDGFNLDLSEFPPQLKLVKQSEQQIEDEGTIEEIESLIFNSEKVINFNNQTKFEQIIRKIARNTKQNILNYFGDEQVRTECRIQ